MRISTAHHVWSELTPRLIDPTKLAIIEALVRLERPLAVGDLAPLLDLADDLVRHHCKVLVQADVLEVADIRQRPDGSGESVFDFPPPL